MRPHEECVEFLQAVRSDGSVSFVGIELAMAMLAGRAAQRAWNSARLKYRLAGAHVA